MIKSIDKKFFLPTSVKMAETTEKTTWHVRDCTPCLKTLWKMHKMLWKTGLNQFVGKSLSLGLLLSSWVKMQMFLTCPAFWYLLSSGSIMKHKEQFLYDLLKRDV